MRYQSSSTGKGTLRSTDSLGRVQAALSFVALLVLIFGFAVARAEPAEPETAIEQPAVEPDSDVDAEIAAQKLSNAARNRMDRARASIVQIRGFFGTSQADAFHGSGFAADADGHIVTNYHVVSEAVLYPKQYRLEYLTPDGRRGDLHVHAVDIEHDLAVVKGADLDLPALRLRAGIPGKGERAYSIGFPLDLGLTITEGVANGLVENALEQRIHYSGAMNGGMSGGPALDGSGAVYGVNVSVMLNKQSVSFVVPAKHIAPLLARAREPLDLRRARLQVAAQLAAHQDALFATIPAQLATQAAGSFLLPAKIAPSVECNSDGNDDPANPIRVEAVVCSARVAVFVEGGLDMGDLRFRHRLLVTDKLHPLQFAEKLTRTSKAVAWFGSDKHVAPFACDNAVVTLNGFDARVSTCVRQYRMFADLYDIGVVVTSLHDNRHALVSNLYLRGVTFASGMKFTQRFLKAYQWNP